MQKVAKFLFKPTVPVVSINGVITERSVEELEKHLKDIRVSTAKALAVIINSPGGSPTQGQKIVETIQNFAHDHHLPIYTFAEDLAASAGFQILISGDKVFVDQNSLVGSIGTIANLVNAKAVIQSQGVEVRRISTNPKGKGIYKRAQIYQIQFHQKLKIQINLLIIPDKSFANRINNKSFYLIKSASSSNLTILNDTPAELKQVYEDLVKTSYKKFVEYVEEQRGSKIKVSKNQREKVIYNGDVFSGKQALEYGLVDSIGRVQDVMHEDFPKAQVVYPKKNTPTGKIVEYAKLYNIFQAIYQK